MFGDGQANWSVFQLLELALMEMCKISLSSRQRAQKPSSAELHDLFVYNTIVWGMFCYLCEPVKYLIEKCI